MWSCDSRSRDQITYTRWRLHRTIRWLLLQEKEHSENCPSFLINYSPLLNGSLVSRPNKVKNTWNLLEIKPILILLYFFFLLIIHSPPAGVSHGGARVTGVSGINKVWSVTPLFSSLSNLWLKAFRLILLVLESPFTWNKIHLLGVRLTFSENQNFYQLPTL